MAERKKTKIKKNTKLKAAKKTKKAAPKAVKKHVAVKKVAKKVSKKAATQSKSGSLEVFDIKGKSIDKITLDPLFVEGDVNKNVVYQAVLMYQAGQREGTAATKTRGEVSGGGKKPWKQKGTGQARHGSRRSPIWRGGGVTFGPHPRDYSYSIPDQLKRKAVVEVVKDKVHNGKLVVLNQFVIDQPKTRIVAGVLDALKLEKPLFLVEEKTDKMLLASRNIQNVAIKTAQEVNALDVASHKECVMTKGAYTGLLKRLKS